MELNGDVGNWRPIDVLREPWSKSKYAPSVPPEVELRAKSYNDALLQALTEMTPAEREKLAW